MDLGLTNKVVMVTGGSKGIGRVVVRGFAREGAQVAMCARTTAQLEQTAKDIESETGCKVLALTADLTKSEEAQRAVDATVQRYGRLDVLVNNAGSAPGGLIVDLTEEHWIQANQLKVMGYVRCTKAAISHMVKQGGGRIVNVVGNNGVKPSATEFTGTAASAALLAMTQALAEEYGRHGIRVNAVNPGPVSTERWGQLVKSLARIKGITVEEAQARVDRSIPLGRIATAEEVADVVVFLASERASFVNGAFVSVDGGQRKALIDVDTKP